MALVGALLANMAIQMVMASRKDTPTFDEPLHIGAAMEKYNGDLEWAADHPPVAQLILGLPLQFLRFDKPEHSAQQIEYDGYQRGREYLYQQDGDEHAARVLQIARFAIVLVTLATMVVVFLFAQDLFGFWGGALALVLASANPTVLAHGRLATTDMVLTGLVFTSVWLIWRSIRSPRRTLVLTISAVVFGFALATKFTALFMLPFALVVVFWYVLRRESEAAPKSAAGVRPALPRALVSVILFTGVSVATVWGIYLAVDPQLEYRSRVTEKPDGLTAQVAAHLPLPEPYRDGLRLQIKWDSFGRFGFLMGESYLGGKPLYYPASLAMKSPIALLAAFILGMVAWFTKARRPIDLLMILLVPFSFLLFAMTTGTNLGVRHVLIVPLFMALIGGAMALRRSRAWIAASIGLAAWALISTWSSYPAHIAYVNEAFGGSDNAYKLFSDSNVDWGQDLGRLREYLAAHRIEEPVWLYYFGAIPVEAYNLPVRIADPNDAGEIQGILAISVTKLNNPNLGPYYRLVENRRPFAQIGHSILLYRIGARAAGPSDG